MQILLRAAEMPDGSDSLLPQVISILSPSRALLSLYRPLSPLVSSAGGIVEELAEGLAAGAAPRTAAGSARHTLRREARRDARREDLNETA